ncbi:chalcone isomerase family protein [Chitinimonas naiadis]
MDPGLISRLCLLLCLALPAQAGWRDVLADAKPVGAGDMRWLGLKLYRAELYSSSGRYVAGQPFALALTYARSFKASRIIDASLDQMRRQGAPSARLDSWAASMRQAFVDVNEGDTLTGVYLPGKGARFYAGDKPTADIDDPEFAHWFFSIWLGQATSEPRLRQQLLGSAP